MRKPSSIGPSNGSGRGNAGWVLCEGRGTRSGRRVKVASCLAKVAERNVPDWRLGGGTQGLRVEQRSGYGTAGSVHGRGGARGH